jgi:hypothetical protein
VWLEGFSKLKTFILLIGLYRQVPNKMGEEKTVRANRKHETQENLDNDYHENFKPCIR